MYKAVLFLFMSFTILFSQDEDSKHFKIQAKGGIGYLFYSDQNNIIFQGIHGINQRQPGLSGSLKISYSPDTYNVFFFGVEIVKANTIKKGSSFDYPTSIEWNLKGFPISAGYQYNSDKITNNLYPFVSTNLSFYISNEKRIRKYFENGELMILNTDTFLTVLLSADGPLSGNTIAKDLYRKLQLLR